MCEGLEQRLKNISLKEMHPPLELQVVDIDSGVISDTQRSLLDLRVPVMALRVKANSQIIEFPRVSPRLKEKELLIWIEKTINKLIPLV